MAQWLLFHSGGVVGGVGSVMVMMSDGLVVVLSQWWRRWWSWLSDGDDE